MENVSLTIDGKQVSVPKGSTVLQAAGAAGVHIPTLCYLEGVHAIGACRVCLVEVEGGRGLQASCVYPVAEGMVVNTATPRVRSARKTVVELMISAHRQECTMCGRSLNCELQEVAKQLGVKESGSTAQCRRCSRTPRHPALCATAASAFSAADA